MDARLTAIWNRTPRDYRRIIGGTKCVLVNRQGATLLVPLDQLTQEEITRKVGTPPQLTTN